MPNNKTSKFVVSDNAGGTQVKVVNPTTAYTVLSDDNVVICGGNSVAVTLNSSSNSPVHISSVDGTTQRTSCTIVVNGNNYRIEDGAPSATCTRVGSSSLWIVTGAKGI